MRKKFYLTIMGLGIVTLVNAQTATALLPNVSFGIKGGANLSALSTQNTFGSENRTGYLAGIWARAGVVGWFIQPELYYSTKKAKFINEANGAENNVKISGMDLPILIGRRFGDNGIYGRINTGPVISFATKNNQTQEGAFNSSLLNIKSQGLQWQFGGGFDISKLSIDLRYEYGLNKIKNGNDQTHVRFNTFNVSLAYRVFAL